MILTKYHLGMNLLNRDSDYALRALIYMARLKREVTSVAELVESLGMPRAFTRKILQRLEKAGILSSRKGNRGGFSLKKRPDKILIIKIIEAFQGKVSLLNCVFKLKICPNIKNCPLRKKIQHIEKGVVRELELLTLAQLLGNDRSDTVKSSMSKRID
jgi:Rrf2 family protein